MNTTTQTDPLAELEAALEDLVRFCNQSGDYTSNATEVIHAEAVLEQLHKSRRAQLAAPAPGVMSDEEMDVVYTEFSKHFLAVVGKVIDHQYAQWHASNRVVPDGWRLVPVEPTEAMLSAGKQEAHTNKGAMTKCVRIFNAMLTAAPAAPAAPAVQGIDRAALVGESAKNSQNVEVCQAIQNGRDRVRKLAPEDLDANLDVSDAHTALFALAEYWQGKYLRLKEQAKAPAVREGVAEFDEFKGRPVLLPNAPMLAHKQKLYTTPPAPDHTEQSQPEPTGANWHAHHVAVNKAALQMVRNALRNDAERGLVVRGEMLEELDKATFAILKQSHP